MNIFRDACGSDISFQIFFLARLAISLSLCIGSVFFGSLPRIEKRGERIAMGVFVLGLIVLVAPFDWGVIVCPGSW